MENKKTTSSTRGGPPSPRGRLTVTLHIGGVQVEKLTPEQVQKVADRLSESTSEYYSNHIEEYRKIQN